MLSRKFLSLWSRTRFSGILKDRGEPWGMIGNSVDLLMGNAKLFLRETSITVKIPFISNSCKHRNYGRGNLVANVAIDSEELAGFAIPVKAITYGPTKG